MIKLVRPVNLGDDAAGDEGSLLPQSPKGPDLHSRFCKEKIGPLPECIQ